MASIKAAAVLTLGLCGASRALTVTILADTNRDGVVDVNGTSDLADKDTWTDERGALFLANIGDSNRRCSSRINATSPPNAELDACNDASGNVQRNPKYLAPVRTRPLANVSAQAVGSVVVADRAAAGQVRVFHAVGSDWVYVAPNYTFSADDLRRGLHLGVDARDVRRPGGWDGRAVLEFAVRDGCRRAVDRVALRVAPVLSHHHRQEAQRVFATAGKLSAGVDTTQERFVRDLGAAAAAAGVAEPLFAIDIADVSDAEQGGLDVWAQDFFEPGYTSMPGPSGPVALRVMVRSSQLDRASGRAVYRYMRSDSVGAVQHLAERVNGRPPYTIDSTGNFETVPPHAHNGRSWPAGRVVLGSQNGSRPLVADFVAAQEVQTPIEIDTSWLAVGHTDEFLQFLPADSERGWLMLVDDPRAGLALLRRAQAEGHGGVAALSRPSLATDPEGCLPNDTINGVLGMPHFSLVQEYAAGNIDANIDIMKRETGVTDAEIVRVPTLFHTDFWSCGDAGPNGTRPGNDSAPVGAQRAADVSVGAFLARELGGRRRRAPLPIVAASGRAAALEARQIDEGPQQVLLGALYPAVINGVVLGNRQYVAANPWGPVIDGRDVLAEATTAAYFAAGFNATYIDDWFSHHMGGGEVHCGSNTVRDMSDVWWQGAGVSAESS